MTRRRRRSVLTSLASLVIVGLVAWSWRGPTLPIGARPGSDPTSPVAAPIPAEESRARLGRLEVADRRPVGDSTYERDAFGTPWSDVDRNGCSQRDDVLLRDAVAATVRVQQQGGCDHDVLAGTWLDPYTGSTLRFDDLKDPGQAQAIQIDHVVPLAEAWVSGASGWDDTRRLRFANDLDGLLAVDGPTNASKGADDPAAWRPRAAHQCAYAVRWVALKERWQLTVDVSEVAALEQLLDSCDD